MTGCWTGARDWWWLAAVAACSGSGGGGGVRKWWRGRRGVWECGLWDVAEGAVRGLGGWMWVRVWLWFKECWLWCACCCLKYGVQRSGARLSPCFKNVFLNCGASQEAFLMRSL